MSGFLNQEEREFLLARVAGSSPQDPIGKLRRAYYIGYLGGTIAPQVPLGDLEYQWILKYIATNGGTVEDSDNYSDLWRKMVMVVGKVPTKYINQNQLVFYSNATA